MSLEYWKNNVFLGTGTTWVDDSNLYQTVANEIFYTTDFEFDTSVTIWF